MWVLVIVFMTWPSHHTVIERFETQQACQVERDRIGFEMAEAYPEEHDFDILCEVQPRVI